jgi:hypothetical protein
MLQSNQKHQNLLVINNINKFFKNKEKIKLWKNPEKFKKIRNTISLIYNLKQKRVWHNNYKKKCQLRAKKEIDFKQQKLISNPIRFILRHKQRKKKPSLIQNRWYYYNENLQKKKTKLNYYQNNLLDFNTNKALYKFFLCSQLFRKNENKAKSLKK